MTNEPNQQQIPLYAECNEQRRAIKAIAAQVQQLRRLAVDHARADERSGEIVANVTLAYRHLEDASMRLGKALQALDGGSSVYDRSTTVGA